MLKEEHHLLSRRRTVASIANLVEVFFLSLENMVKIKRSMQNDAKSGKRLTS
jgi:hypothetical protein